MTPRNGTADDTSDGNSLAEQFAAGEPPHDVEAMSHARLVSERSGSSFLSGIRVLPAARRDGMYAIYAFCRDVDDIADEPRPLDEKRRLLLEWRDEIDRLYDGAPTSLIGRALLQPVARYNLRKKDFNDLIDGMTMDADESATHGPRMNVLDLYCDRVASSVGRLSVRVFGDDSEAAQDVAHSLGRALQLTNILRDISEDAEIGRLYLPDELLARHAVITRVPAEVLRHPSLPAVCEELALIARNHYQDALTAIGACSRQHMRPAILMMHVYRKLLDMLCARGWAWPYEPVKVSKAAKLWILLRHGFI